MSGPVIQGNDPSIIGEVNPDLISQAEAEAGLSATERIFSALRVKQAILALAIGDPDQTGAEIKALYEAEVSAFTDALFAKLNAIEALADVTDATNVNAAGAVMETDTSSAAVQFVIDEDNMVSDSATKVPTQQSVKAYVDNLLTSDLTLIGDYNASTNTPDLDTSPSGILKGDYYVVTVAGTFFTEALAIGDTIIAKQDNPTLLTHWIRTSQSLTAVEIKTLNESNANTNAFTDADESKLDAIEASATADQSDAEIKTAYENATSKTLASVDKLENNIETIASGASIAIDMSTEDVAEIDELGHAVTFTTSSRGIGRKKEIHITTDGTARALTFSESWRWLTAIPTTTNIDKNAVLSLRCVHGTLVTDVVASWVEQP